MLKKFTTPIILYLIGLAGTGKLTIAQRLQSLGFKIIDNHLINDPIFKTLELDGKAPIPEEAWAAIHQIRDIVFRYIATNPVSSFIFTNELLEGNEQDQALCQKVQGLARKRGSIFIPVRLLVSSEERARRIVSEDRKNRCKWVGEDRRESIEVMTFSHPNLLTLDVSQLSAQQAAEQIEAHIHDVLASA